ncbi:hypothetical protein HPB49_011798 [Dermacentor silvarum]|uniref:Uncharacterized protein n=1 Tax=Dermacentor silvarum TaxID=543639 RepID=A0ACB8DP92_DERSI|nr:hypothetical protein HPB49_011798 [Dermacentor silvarum]
MAHVAALFSLLLGTAVAAEGDDLCLPIPQSNDVGDRCTCPFTTEMDVDPTRVPSALPVVKCKCPGILCTMLGDFRCTEVSNTFSVVYPTVDGQFTSNRVELSTSCVCATSRSENGASDDGRTIMIGR